MQPTGPGILLPLASNPPHQSGDEAGDTHEHSLIMMQGERLKKGLRATIIPNANGKLDNSFHTGSCCAR